ncbi:Aerobactin synthase [Carnimonas sp. R-84981]|uniref:IucA/IucC family protein n=1 Tax=Carnimonas bestiolae TaxID=3402172 RepID=UPI003EDBAC0A
MNTDIHVADVHHALTPQRWQQANQHLVAKILAEFSHERIIAPTAVASVAGNSTTRWQLIIEQQDERWEYGFDARQFMLEHLQVDPASITCTLNGQPKPVDALMLVIALKDKLGISEQLLPTYMEEITSTLYGKAFKLAFRDTPVAALIDADYQEMEASMTEGHPIFIANNGRIGFDEADYLNYTPESARPMRVRWLAGHRNRTNFHALADIHYDNFIEGELGQAQWQHFRQQLKDRQLNPDDYVLIPVHPWQWREKIARVFTADIANQWLIDLGEGSDHYQVQQSIRTFFNLDAPARCYVKTSLSILNMGFMRGLSPYYMARTPAINAFAAKLLASDRFFAEHHFHMLREVATVGYHHRYYEMATSKSSPYHKMLSGLWRESPYALEDPAQPGQPLIKPNQTLMTMAALLHQDSSGDALVAALVSASSLSPSQWLERLLDLYYIPLLHAFFAHDLAFMPHGENLILVMEDYVPVAIFMKDIGEEIALVNPREEPPEEVEGIRFSIADGRAVDVVFTDLFDCIFRFVAPLMASCENFTETAFWQLVTQKTRDYQRAHPENARQYQRYDLFAPEFVRTCLNRIQLRNNQQMINLDERDEELPSAGTLANPLYLAEHGWKTSTDVEDVTTHTTTHMV